MCGITDLKTGGYSTAVCTGAHPSCDGTVAVYAAAVAIPPKSELFSHYGVHHEGIRQREGGTRLAHPLLQSLRIYCKTHEMSWHFCR